MPHFGVYITFFFLSTILEIHDVLESSEECEELKAVSSLFYLMTGETCREEEDSPEGSSEVT